MIVDTLKNLEIYENVHSAFVECQDFIQEKDLFSLPVGTYEIWGKDLYCVISEYAPSKEEKPFEAHEKYVDLQVILSGKERIDYAPLAICAPHTPYDCEKDIKFITSSEFTPISLDRGNFAVFFPDDAHRPSVFNGAEQVKKAVFKIKI